MKNYTGLFVIFFITINTIAQEVQWRGPERSGIFPEKGLLQEWPKSGPETILKVEGIGVGFSSPVLDDGIIYVTGKIDEDDYLQAVNQDGEILYKVAYGKAWTNTYPDTRSTPTVDEDRIYLISGTGQVVCLQKTDGEILWSADASQNHNGEIHRWGVAESPLIVDDKVIYTNGGDETSVIAYNKISGEIAWATESVGGSRTYVSPIIYQHENVRLIIASTSDFVMGIKPDSGEIAWKYNYLPEDPEQKRRATISPNSAIVKGNEIFISKGYNQYGVMLKVAEDGNQVTEKWRTTVLDTHHGHYVNIGDYIYGSTWESNSKGNWACIRWDTGKVMYEETWITKGPIAYADQKLYCIEERTGNVALVNLNPKKFDIVSSFKIEYGAGPYWAHPYIVDGKLLIRHGDVLMVFNIKA